MPRRDLRAKRRSREKRGRPQHLRDTRCSSGDAVVDATLGGVCTLSTELLAVRVLSGALARTGVRSRVQTRRVLSRRVRVLLLNVGLRGSVKTGVGARL